MVSQTHIDLEQMEDLFAFLYNSAPQLLCLFVRMPTTRVGYFFMLMRRGHLG